MLTHLLLWCLLLKLSVPAGQVLDALSSSTKEVVRSGAAAASGAIGHKYGEEANEKEKDADLMMHSVAMQDGYIKK